MGNDNTTIDTAQNNPLVRRGFLYLEDSNWKEAEKTFNDALNQAPENAASYIGLLLTELRLTKEEELGTTKTDYSANSNYEKALRFATEEYRTVLEKYSLENIYNRAIANFNETSTKKVENAKKMFESIIEYNDASSYILQCEEKILLLQKREKAKKRKIIISIISVISIIVVILISVLIIKTNSNQKRADMIYQNILGKTFTGTYQDDQGFTNDYRYNKLKNQAYFLTKKTYSLQFNEDGTVDWQEYYEYTLLAAPTFMQDQMKKFNTSYSNDGKSYFSVRVALNGTAYIKISTEEYELMKDGSYVPYRICDYGSSYKTDLDKPKPTIVWEDHTIRIDN